MVSTTVYRPKNQQKVIEHSRDFNDDNHAGVLFVDEDGELFLGVRLPDGTTVPALVDEGGRGGIWAHCSPSWPLRFAPNGTMINIERTEEDVPCN